MKESGRGTCLRVAKGGRWPDVLVNIFFFYFLKQPYFVIFSRFWNSGVTIVFDLYELDAYMYSYVQYISVFVHAYKLFMYMYVYTKICLYLCTNLLRC